MVLHLRLSSQYHAVFAVTCLIILLYKQMEHYFTHIMSMKNNYKKSHITFSVLVFSVFVFLFTSIFAFGQTSETTTDPDTGVVTTIETDADGNVISTKVVTVVTYADGSVTTTTVVTDADGNVTTTITKTYTTTTDTLEQPVTEDNLASPSS